MRLCLAGGIASGKSILAGAIADRICYPSMSFGGALRRISDRNGWPSDRGSLQALGQSRIEELGYPRFLDWIVGQAGYDWSAPLIVDGVRHGEIYRLIADQFHPAMLVFMECSPELQLSRLVRRDGLSEAQARRVLAHETEMHLPELMTMSTLIVRADQDIGRQVSNVMAHMA